MKLIAQLRTRIKQNMISKLLHNHVDVTANQQRHKVSSSATVIKSCMVSSTVKCLTIKVHNPDFTFKAGQWVDFTVPGLEEVGGYSICSGAQELKHKREIQLAVKKSEFPTAVWIHEKCQDGCEVNVRPGGDFFYEPETINRPHDLLLVAGGVGINPVISIFKHAADWHESTSKKELAPQNVHLLYSAQTHDELIFKDAISEICKNTSGFLGTFFVTRENSDVSHLGLKQRRIDESEVFKAIRPFSSQCKFAYVCGPPPMLMAVESILQKAHYSREEIIYEKWW